MKVVSTDTMRYVYEYDSEYKVLRVSASGKMDNNTFHEVATTFWDEVDKYDCDRALFDYLDFTVIDSVLDLYDRPKEAISVSGGRRIKIEGLVKEMHRNYRFIESIYVNRGFNVGFSRIKKTQCSG